jgi:hypothetical protein
MMETEITCDWIDRYTNNELNEQEKELFQQWMLANPLLRSEVDIDARLSHFLMDQELLDLMAKVGSVSRKSDRDSRIMRAMLIAASILCLAVISGLIYLLDTSSIKSGKAVIEPDSHIQPGFLNETDISDMAMEKLNPGAIAFVPFHHSAHQRLAQNNYKPLAEFELLIGSVTRSYQFEMISPGAAVSVNRGSDVLFEWHCYDKAGPLLLILLNNHGIAVSEFPLNDAGPFMLKTKNFAEGLYYWKILKDDELVLMGKITIFQDN